MSYIKIQLIEIYLRWIWRIPTSPSEGKVLLVLEKIKKIIYSKYWNLKVKRTIIDYFHF